MLTLMPGSVFEKVPFLYSLRPQYSKLNSLIEETVLRKKGSHVNVRTVD